MYSCMTGTSWAAQCVSLSNLIGCRVQENKSVCHLSLTGDKAQNPASGGEKVEQGLTCLCIAKDKVLPSFSKYNYNYLHDTSYIYLSCSLDISTNRY